MDTSNTKVKSLSRICYPVIQDGNTFYFNTSAGNQIKISFTKVWFHTEEIIDFFSDQVEIFEFQFERVKFRSKKFDLRTSLTILKTAFNFLSNSRVIFYTADSPTKKDRELFRLYDIWYQKNIDQQQVAKIDRQVIIDENHIFFSCFVRYDFFLPVEKVTKLYESVLEELYPGGIVSAYYD